MNPAPLPASGAASSSDDDALAAVSPSPSDGGDDASYPFYDAAAAPIAPITAPIAASDDDLGSDSVDEAVPIPHCAMDREDDYLDDGDISGSDTVPMAIVSDTEAREARLEARDARLDAEISVLRAAATASVARARARAAVQRSWTAAEASSGAPAADATTAVAGTPASDANSNSCGGMHVPNALLIPRTPPHCNDFNYCIGRRCAHCGLCSLCGEGYIAKGKGKGGDDVD